VTPIGSELRDAFIAIFLFAGIVAAVTASIAIAVAALAVSSLCFGAALAIRSHRSSERSGPKAH